VRARYGGRRFEVSTRTTDEEDARRFLDNLERVFTREDRVGRRSGRDLATTALDRQSDEDQVREEAAPEAGVVAIAPHRRRSDV
jgi:hypothetical protein